MSNGRKPLFKHIICKAVLSRYYAVSFSTAFVNKRNLVDNSDNAEDLRLLTDESDLWLPVTQAASALKTLRRGRVQTVTCAVVFASAETSRRWRYYCVEKRRWIWFGCTLPVKLVIDVTQEGLEPVKLPLWFHSTCHIFCAQCWPRSVYFYGKLSA